jgi:hypothetical protein
LGRVITMRDGKWGTVECLNGAEALEAASCSSRLV